MVVIRLARGGRSKYPTYRIVAAESARAATGQFVAILGHYNPHTKELTINHEETLKFLGNGAQPSNTVIKLLQREKVELPKWVHLKTKAPKPVEAKADQVAEEETVTADTEAEVSDTEPATDAAPATPDAADEQRVATVAEDTEAASEDVASDTAATNKNLTETADNAPEA